jgi:hypothetical protein
MNETKWGHIAGATTWHMWHSVKDGRSQSRCGASTVYTQSLVWREGQTPKRHICPDCEELSQKEHRP